jgi:iron complex outermembrane receptor protein
MARVQVLEGPRSTLFGGGAQAGVIRYVTNKPNLTDASGEFNAGYGITAGGGPNSGLGAVFNMPLIADALAVRAVIFSDHRGGYIANVPGTISFNVPSPNLPYVRLISPVANNANLLRRDSNPVNYEGFRMSALYKISDDWNVIVQQNYQDTQAEGYFYAYPFDSNGNALQPYQIAAFTSAYNKDRYESTAWTLNGKIDDLSLVYSGSYMTRHIDGQQDYSNYLRSVKGAYYACIGPGAGYFAPPGFPGLTGHSLRCYPPVGAWRDIVDNTHWSHELRVSTNPASRVRGLVGVYWEKFVINDNMNFNYLTIPQCDPANLAAALAGGPDCLSAVGPVPGTQASDPSLRAQQNDAFGEDDQRGYKQLAEFVSVDFDLIPKALTLTGGTRHYRYEEFEHGSEWYSQSTAGQLILDHANGICTTAGLCGFPIKLDKREEGYRSQGNLTWRITPDVLAYYTFSQGFRPGGFNRTNSANGMVQLAAVAPYIAADRASSQYERPTGYNSDDLTNNEIGFKSELFGHRVLLNVSAYYMHWSNIQLTLFDPARLGNTPWNVNGPSYTVKGFEAQFVARISDGLTVQGSSSVNSPYQTTTPCLASVGVDPNNPRTANNPTPKGQCITQVAGRPYTNPFGQLGTRPPFAPPWMFNLRARYDWAVGNYKPFGWVGASHIASMSSEPANFPAGDNNPAEVVPDTTLLRYEIPGYTTYDAGLGVTEQSWTAQIQGSNLTNAYGPTNISSGQFIKATIPLRPRVLMLTVSYRF